jgi:hypothetical protein
MSTVAIRLFATKLPFARSESRRTPVIRIGSDCWVRYGSNKSGQNGGTNDDKGKDCSYLGLGDYTEKAGVGGLTPSLATKS